VTSLTEKPRESGPPASAVSWDKALRALATLPPFSPILNRLLASLAGEEVSFAALAGLIEKDTVVAGNVLHLVNSALYARRGTVNSVRHAVSLLGVDKLRNGILGMSITRMWRTARPADSWPTPRFNLHSAATAILSDMLADRLRVEYPEGAFVAGLMHDVGRLLIAVGLPQEHDLILERYRSQGGPIEDHEVAVLGFAHPELSQQALAYWKLPEPIQWAVRDHHAPPAADPSGELRLARVIAAADQYVNAAGISILVPGNRKQANLPSGSLPQSVPDAGPMGAVLEPLGVSGPPLDALLGEFQAEFDAMAPFFR